MITRHHPERAPTTTLRDTPATHELDTMPLTISHVGDAIDELARGVLRLSDTVGPDLDHLPAEERALAWHLHELAARLRAARASAETAHHWARELAGRDGPPGQASMSPRRMA